VKAYSKLMWYMNHKRITTYNVRNKNLLSLCLERGERGNSSYFTGWCCTTWNYKMHFLTGTVNEQLTIIITLCMIWSSHRKYHIYRNIRRQFFPNSSSEKKKWGHCIISNKIKHILHRYFPKNWRLWRGRSVHLTGVVILYSGKYGMCNLSILPWTTIQVCRSYLTVSASIITSWCDEWIWHMLHLYAQLGNRTKNSDSILWCI